MAHREFSRQQLDLPVPGNRGNRRGVGVDAPTEISYGGHYQLRTPNADSLQWVQLIRPMATTHSCDTEQRIVDLLFTVHGPCAVRISIPGEPNLAPPGWWMLNVVDTQRRPSESRWVHLTQH